MFSPRPLIAVTGPSKRWPVGWWATRFILFLVGARSCYITAVNPQLPAAVDAVVIGGGDDIDPQHYGETGDAGATYDPARDQLEMTMIRAALNARIPILGICRGAQLLNVVLGGSLYQDIRPLRQNTPNRNSAFFIKWAHIKPDSLLHRIVQRKKLPINSLHSQAVKRVAEGLHIVAKDADDFVQAFEYEHPPFCMGVQWHPEYLPYYRSQRQIFRYFVNAVDGKKQLLPSLSGRSC